MTEKSKKNDDLAKKIFDFMRNKLAAMQVLEVLESYLDRFDL